MLTSLLNFIESSIYIIEHSAWSIINTKYNLRRTCILESLEEVCFLFQFKSCFEVFTLVKFRLCTRTMFHPFVCPELGTVVARARQRWPVLSQIADQIWDLCTYAKANSRKLTLARLLKFIFFILGIFQVFYYFIIVPIEPKLIIRVPREPWIYILWEKNKTKTKRVPETFQKHYQGHSSMDRSRLCIQAKARECQNQLPASLILGSNSFALYHSTILATACIYIYIYTYIQK